MGNPLANIRAAFVTKLQAFPSLPSVAWENMPFAPATGVPYLRPVLLPGEPLQCEIGANGNNRHTGIYQISIFYPVGSGIANLNTLTIALCDHFKRGSRLTYGGATISIQKAYPATYLQETDWIHVPITIQYLCDSPN